MTQHKKGRSTASVHALLRKVEQELQAYAKKVGPVPKLHPDHHEAQFRNHLRMRRSMT
jgi:hypothetical protein